jgi:hypothetical protein
MRKLTLYSDCLAYGFLPYKKKYTMSDAKMAVIDSLFTSKLGRTLTLHEAQWLCKCSAVYHNSNYSRSIQ